MNVVPKTIEWDGVPRLRTVPAPDDRLIIECEISDPPSRKGQTVYVMFDREQVPMLLRDARDSAIAARSRTDPTTRTESTDGRDRDHAAGHAGTGDLPESAPTPAD